MGRRVLETIGFDNKRMPEAACEKGSGMMEFEKELDASRHIDEIEGVLVGLFGELMFHNMRIADDDGTIDNDVCIEFRHDSKLK